MYNFSDGSLRLFMFLGLIFGLILYMLTLSKIIIKTVVTIITILKGIIYKIIKIVITPLKIIYNIIDKIIFRPIYIFYIKFKTSLTKKSKKFNFKIDSLNQTREELISTQENVNSPEYIEAIAREKLDMYLPNERVYVDNEN